MKALIICDDDDVIAKTKETLAYCGYDSIVYRWLLKALDNVEEIEPDLVILSSQDYPRHWKTFVSHIHTCSLVEKEKMPKVILFTSETISDEEEKKADTLGICGFYSNVRFSGLENLKEIVNGKTEAAKPIVVERKEKLPSPAPVKKELGNTLVEDILAIGESLVASDKKNTTGSIKNFNKKYSNQKMIFTHPMNKTFITGNIVEISDDEKTIDFSPDILQSIKGISVGDKIKELSLKTLNGMRCYRAEVIRISAEKLTINIA